MQLSEYECRVLLPPEEQEEQEEQAQQVEDMQDDGQGQEQEAAAAAAAAAGGPDDTSTSSSATASSSRPLSLMEGVRFLLAPASLAPVILHTADNLTSYCLVYWAPTYMMDVITPEKL